MGFGLGALGIMGLGSRVWGVRCKGFSKAKGTLRPFKPDEHCKSSTMLNPDFVGLTARRLKLLALGHRAFGLRIWGLTSR